jgi:hypothetical protein
MNIKEFSQSKILKGIIIGFSIFFILTFVFQMGQYFGLRKALYLERLEDNYGQIFGEERHPANMMGGMFDNLPFDNLPGSHGAAGAVIKVSSTTLVVAEPGNVEKIVTVNDKTLIRKGRGQIDLDDVLIGDAVSIIGDANDHGIIVAKLVRVLPSRPVAATSTIKTK